MRAKFEVTVRVTLSLASLSSMLKIPDKTFLIFLLPAACRLFSRGVIFTRARVSLAPLSLRKNGGLLVVQNSPIKQLDTTQSQLHAQRLNGRDETLFRVFDVACEQQTYFRSSLLSLRRERSDDRKYVRCSQAMFDETSNKRRFSRICKKMKNFPLEILIHKDCLWLF